MKESSLVASAPSGVMPPDEPMSGPRGARRETVADSRIVHVDNLVRLQPVALEQFLRLIRRPDFLRSNVPPGNRDKVLVCPPKEWNSRLSQ